MFKNCSKQTISGQKHKKMHMINKNYFQSSYFKITIFSENYFRLSFRYHFRLENDHFSIEYDRSRPFSSWNNHSKPFLSHNDNFNEVFFHENFDLEITKIKLVVLYVFVWGAFFPYADNDDLRFVPNSLRFQF